MKVTTLAQNVGKGLAGRADRHRGMTVSSTVEARMRGRAASSAPADATAKVLGIAEFESPEAKNRFSTLSHWGYGTSWGVVRARCSPRRPPPRAATAAQRRGVRQRARDAAGARRGPAAFLWRARRWRSMRGTHLVYGRRDRRGLRRALPRQRQRQGRRARLAGRPRAPGWRCSCSAAWRRFAVGDQVPAAARLQDRERLLFATCVALIAVSPLGRRSGAHINPAVTLAFRAAGWLPWIDTGGYIAAQLAGAALGSLCSERCGARHSTAR